MNIAEDDTHEREENIPQETENSPHQTAEDSLAAATRRGVEQLALIESLTGLLAVASEALEMQRLQNTSIQTMLLQIIRTQSANCTCALNAGAASGTANTSENANTTAGDQKKEVDSNEQNYNSSVPGKRTACDAEQAEEPGQAKRSKQGTEN